MVLYIIILLLVVVLIVVYFNFKNIVNKELDKEYNALKDKFITQIDNELKDAKTQLLQLNTEIKNKQQFNEFLHVQRENEIQLHEKEINEITKIRKDKALSDANKEITEWTKSAQEAANINAAIIIKEYKAQIDEKRKEYEDILLEIKNFQEKREAINQEILRTRAIEEQQEFYKIQLDDSSKRDIELLNDIKTKLNHSELLDKLIFDNYILRPTKEMIKRILNGRNPTGIYKVTNIKTKEIYIGKSVKIADRILNHVKSAYGLEGVAESQFQRALKKYGIESFTWEILKEVPKENLTECEKYFIIFYGTKEYGYNQREG